MLPELRARMHEERADLVLLQEAVGHRARTQPDNAHPGEPQYEYLADGVWPDFAYGKNAVTENSHHGNAILSRFPIEKWENFNISTNGLERRGVLLTRVSIPERGSLYCLCTHLDLTAWGRRKQFAAIRHLVNEHVPAEAPLVLGGDFNDWRVEATAELAEPLGMIEAFAHLTGQVARTFPARLPMLRLDRIYLRGLRVQRARTLASPAWRRLSDHLAIGVELGWP
jgi:endonuclease/exonuclease/phosphatase family metal-dependent hydrolase